MHSSVYFAGRKCGNQIVLMYFPVHYYTYVILMHKSQMFATNLMVICLFFSLIFFQTRLDISLGHVHRSSGRISENIYSFTAEANDNKARFRCEANNIMSQTPLKAEIDLTVMCKYWIVLIFLPLLLLIRRRWTRVSLLNTEANNDSCVAPDLNVNVIARGLCINLDFPVHMDAP